VSQEDDMALKTPLSRLAPSLSTWLASGRDALTRVRDAIAEKTREHEAATAELGALMNAKAPKSDAIHRLAVEVERLGEQWRARHADNLVAIAGTMNATGSGVDFPHGLDALVAVDLPLLCCLVPSLVRDGLARAIGALTYVEGPAMATRASAISDARVRIEELESQHRNLVDAARELGVTLEDLPANHARRLKAEREAAAARRDQIERLRHSSSRAAREAVMNADHLEDLHS